MPNVSLWLIMPLILSTNLLALLHTKSLYKDVIIYNDIISQMIMKRMRIIVSICIMLCTSLLTKAQNQILTLDDLDHEIAMSPRYDKKFEDYIRSVKKQLHDARTNQARYELSDKLFNLYTSYSVDSAIVYALNKQKIAKLMGDKHKINDAKLNLAYLFIRGGQLLEANDIVNSIPRKEIGNELSFYYFSTRKTLYHTLADASLTSWQKRQYKRMEKLCNDSVVDNNASPDIWSRAEQLVNRQQYEQAKKILLDAYRQHSLSDRQTAFIAISLADIYGKEKNLEAEKQYLIAASISDIRNSVKEYLALQQLAVILFEEGDTKRAYAYMDKAMNDAVFCNARQRTIAMSDIWPVIVKSHEREAKSRTLRLTVSLVLISLLSIFLLMMIIYIRRRIIELRAIRARLSNTNEMLKESNHIKDEYITRFLTQCSDYIDKLDSYRKQIYRLVTGNKRTELLNTLKSQEVIDRELDSFYASFDETFLGLFPNFVSDFNALLKPEEQIVPKQPGHLSTDLRIFALIRLGVNENELICSFLRCSKATVYAYRSRVRLKSINPDTFDEMVLKL